MTRRKSPIYDPRFLVIHSRSVHMARPVIPSTWRDPVMGLVVAVCGFALTAVLIVAR